MRLRTDLLLLVAFCGFLFFYGLGSIGLLGADEPRYAQIAREMLDRGDWVTPVLNGKPWLEKPPLYYWQAMISYRVARLWERPSGAEKNNVHAGDGVNEKTARIPAAFDAAIMIAAIYLYMRRKRLREGRTSRVEIDAALITASSVGIVGFAHAAATDMPLTATFTIAMLAWFEWYETERRADLLVFYFFLALGMLAKGPIAPALSAVIIVLFAGLQRKWAIVGRTLSVSGILLFLAVSLPWYIAVQLRNHDFFRIFILEHNLARFSTNVYHHPQPFWFYLPVFLVATMPWTLWLILAIVEHLRPVVREGLNAFASDEDAWALFLLIWMFIPIVFFSFSQSKLPGYILPALPAATLLIADYLARRSEGRMKISFPLAAVHAVLCGALIFAALAAPRAAYHALKIGPETLATLAIPAIVAFGIMITLIMPAGQSMLRPVTVLAIILSLATVVRFAAGAIDATQSSRPIAETISSFSSESVEVALYHPSRTVQYGLDFYLNRPTENYDAGEIPQNPHVLAAPIASGTEFSTLIPGRKVSYLTSLPDRKLNLYWIGK